MTRKYRGQSSWGGGLSDAALLEKCAAVLAGVDLELATQRLRAVHEGAALRAQERDHYVSIARAHRLIRPPKRGSFQSGVEPDGSYSVSRTEGTARASDHLRAWTRPGGQMPTPPGRRAS